MVKINCRYCGNPIETFPSRIGRKKYCSKKCKAETETNRINRICKACGKDFDVVPSELKHGPCDYCSPDCWYDSIGRKMARVCKYCGKDFEAFPSLVRVGGGNYCCPTCWNTANRGENHSSWKGGLTAKNALERNRFKYKQWRNTVYARDNWTCQDCGTKGDDFHAHHIFPFADFPEHRYDLWNGITLCVDCHSNAHPNQNIVSMQSIRAKRDVAEQEKNND